MARTSAGKTILVVDDMNSVRRSLRTALEHQGYRVIEAASGDQALTQVVLHRPDLIVLDVMMPGKSGLQVSAAIKSRSEYRKIPIILLSAELRGKEEDWKKQSFADAALAKPCKAREVLALVETLLGQKPPASP